MLSFEQQSALADFALAKLWEAYTAGERCCPRCCAACWALKTSLDAGQLDELLWQVMDDDDRFSRNQVDRRWLAEVWEWKGHTCPEDEDEAHWRPEEQTDDPQRYTAQEPGAEER